VKIFSKAKPPLGLRPRDIATTIRIQEIDEAILRYLKWDQYIVIPLHWIYERNELVEFLKDQKEK